MSARLVSLLVVLIAVSAFSQQRCLSQRINQKIDSHEQRISQIASEPSPAEVDARAVRLRAIQRDAEELSGLSASVQSDLQQLGKGLLAKDLNARLKKMEKLSKKLRQELEQ
jgi:hypothetical protein